MKPLSIFLITLYQGIAPFRGACRFVPTCSEYAKDALSTQPFLEAVFLIAKRLIRCQPFAKSGLDMVKRKVHD